MHLHRIASQFYNRPLMLTRASAEAISNLLLSRVASESVSVEALNTLPSSQDRDTGKARSAAPYRCTPEGVAIITVVGELVNRGAWIGAQSGLVSYEGIKYQISKA